MVSRRVVLLESTRSIFLSHQYCGGFPECVNNLAICSIQKFDWFRFTSSYLFYSFFNYVLQLTCLSR